MSLVCHILTGQSHVTGYWARALRLGHFTEGHASKAEAARACAIRVAAAERKALVQLAPVAGSMWQARFEEAPEQEAA